MPLGKGGDIVTAKILTAAVCLLLGVLAVPAASARAQDEVVHLEEGRKSVNGAELYYKVMGTGEPIVMLHGGPGFEHTYLLPQLGELAKRYRLIFYDQRTSGGSVASTDSASITLEAFVADLEGIREAFGLDRMNLLGHSWGGMLAMFYALEHPDNVNSLMLISSGGARSDFWGDLGANIARNRTSEDSVMLAEFSGDPTGDAAAFERYMMVFFRSYFYDVELGDSLNMKVTDTTRKNMGLLASTPLNRAIRNYDIVDRLSEIEVPTLIVHGRQDVIPVGYAEEIHDHIPGSELVILEQCGHFPYIEKPAEFFDIIGAFMDEVSRR